MTGNHPRAVGWAGVDSPIGGYIREESGRTLKAYRSQPTLVAEQANEEQDTARGGYARRQVIELIQNSADQLSKTEGGSIHIRLTSERLYCADAGAPTDEEGVKALLFSHLSPKRDTHEIGRFGVGFKSVLGVSDSPDFFSRGGSFRFDRERAAERIREVVPGAERVPVLRVAEPVDPDEAAKADPHLQKMMEWAANIVRLPLKQRAHDDLAEQLQKFPAQFLLFTPHVRRLDLSSDNGEFNRTLALSHVDDWLELDDGQSKSRWMLSSRIHRLSDAAKHDARALDDAEKVDLKWAAPLDSQLGIRHFWAFFPTMTSSLLAGILNAPWKTNEDRRNLLPGPYNDELIDAAVELVAENLSRLSTTEDPARHLDVLPRRRESGDNDHACQLRSGIYQCLQQRECVPDQDGVLQRHTEIHYPPKEFTSGSGHYVVADNALEIWASDEHRPPNWLHRTAITANRLGAIDRIFRYRGGDNDPRAPRASIAEWLEALVEEGKRTNDAVGASKAAIAAAAAPRNGGLWSSSMMRRADRSKSSNICLMRGLFASRKPC